MAPISGQAQIDLSLAALPKYTIFSILRIFIAYVFSLVFSIGYGYIAAYYPRAERVMIPLLDTLQSIPVLSFLPGVMVSMVALFPTRELGVELGSILLIFTGQVWNMAFSFYSSLKSIPREMQEVAQTYRWSRWQRLTQLELPFSAIGMIWNSIMSVAGGWFFLIACEMFTLGDRDLRLPGLGSYLQTAANDGNLTALGAGLVVMVGVVICTDLMVWRPVIAWADKFKFEQVEGAEAPKSAILTLLRYSRLLSSVNSFALQPLRERVNLHFARQNLRAVGASRRSSPASLVTRVLLLVFGAGLAYGIVRMMALLASTSIAELRAILIGAAATFLRVEFVLLLAALWTVPVGVMIGLNRRLGSIAQPLTQVAASVPATALFPIILLALIRIGGGLGVGSIVLLLLGTQWYILFNVIAGALALPTDLKEVCGVFGFKRRDRWRTFFLPGIFPYLITGLVTASGGAWNASIIAEYFHFKGRTYSTTGLGAVISYATDSGNLRLLLAATVVMAAMVVTINRLVWRRLYALASTRFKLDS